MSKLNVQNIHKINLEYFKTIPMNELDNSKFLDYLFYYEKNDIIKFCFNHPVYAKYIKDNNLMNEYCLGISLEKTNKEIIDYLLNKKIITENDFLTEKNLSYFVWGENNLDYIKENLKNKELINKLGNLAIYHVKPDLLNTMIEKEFKDINIYSLLFCIKNHVDLEKKEKVFNLLDTHCSLENVFKTNFDKVIEEKEVFSKNNQLMDLFIEKIFQDCDISKLFLEKMSFCLNVIEIEQNLQKNYFKNKILLENIYQISEESLQKIKKFNKDFFREIEKSQLYKELNQNYNNEISSSQNKKHKI